MAACLSNHLQFTSSILGINTAAAAVYCCLMSWCVLLFSRLQKEGDWSHLASTPLLHITAKVSPHTLEICSEYFDVQELLFAADIQDIVIAQQHMSVAVFSGNERIQLKLSTESNALSLHNALTYAQRAGVFLRALHQKQESCSRSAIGDERKSNKKRKKSRKYIEASHEKQK